MSNQSPLNGFRQFNETYSLPQSKNLEGDEREPIEVDLTAVNQFDQKLFCHNCGNRIINNQHYCNQCGISLLNPYENSPISSPTKNFTNESEKDEQKLSIWLLAGLICLVFLGGLVMLAKPMLSEFQDQANISSNNSVDIAPAQTKQNDAIFSALTNTAPPAKRTIEPTSTSASSQKAKTATITPGKQASACPGAPEQRLEVNEDAKVCTREDNVFLRSGPSKQEAVIEKVSPGTVVLIIDGPECSNSWSWWMVRLNDGTTGWMSEGGDREDPYYLCPN